MVQAPNYWLPYVPTDKDRQESQNPWVETNGCDSFAHVHLIEIWVKYWTGREVDYSEQALTVLSGTDPVTGNDNEHVMAAIKQYGLITTDVLPEPETFTLAQFYTRPSDAKIATGKDFLQQWDIGEETVCGDINRGILTSPVLAQINLGTTQKPYYHLVVYVTPTQYFDSYGANLVKDTHYPITGMWNLTIKPKVMSNAEFYHKTGTKEYGFALPALSEDALKDKAFNLGINILNDDGTINYGSAKEVSGL